MDDERVDRLLRALPREMASPGFTARVLARLDHLERVEAAAGTRRAARIFGLPRLTLPAVVLAATLAVAASLSLQGGGMLPSPGAAGRQSARALHSLGTPQGTLARVTPATSLATLTTLASTGRMQEVRATKQARALLQEIRAYHSRLHDEMRQREAQSSKIYLGGDEDADLVVHLDQVRELPNRQDEPPPYRYD